MLEQQISHFTCNFYRVGLKDYFQSIDFSVINFGNIEKCLENRKPFTSLSQSQINTKFLFPMRNTNKLISFPNENVRISRVIDEKPSIPSSYMHKNKTSRRRTIIMRLLDFIFYIDLKTI